MTPKKLEILFHPKATKELKRIPDTYRQRIFSQLSKLEKLTHPLKHPHVIKLAGKNRSDFRLRIGVYRVKFTFREPNQILITHVQHRQAGY
jgi:mRNA-degrading endonuclease RelE of RelBE toxin-antitoxin system